MTRRLSVILKTIAIGEEWIIACVCSEQREYWQGKDGEMDARPEARLVGKWSQSFR